MRHFWIGVAAGCAFLVVELGARLVVGAPTLPELIQDRLVQLLPGPVFSFVLDHLLYLGKPSLFAALNLVELVIAGLGGLLYPRSRRPLAFALVPWLVLGLVVLPVAGAGIFADQLAVGLTELLALVVYAQVLAAASGDLAGWWARPTPTPVEPSLDRRVLLGGGVAFLVSVVLGRAVVGTLPALPTPPDVIAASPASPAPAATATAATAMVTPASTFYDVSKNLVDPVVDIHSWRLSVTGMVGTPLTLTYAELTAMPAVHLYRTLECISNEVGGDLISNGDWTGVRFGDVLRRAKVQAGATLLHFTSVDDYTETMTLAQAMDPATLLAYQLDGAPLPARHGYPLRVLGAGTYGMKNPKWLSKIELTREKSTGFWEAQGWDAGAIVQTMSRIDAPTDGATVRSGTVSVRGIAFAGARGITKVELSTDGGRSWSPATLDPTLGPDTWTFWTYPWHATSPGPYKLFVRATDGAGHVQTSVATDTYPAGSTGLDRIVVQVAPA